MTKLVHVVMGNDFKTVDRNGDLLVQKVTKNGVLHHYDYGNENLGWVSVASLADARNAIGKVHGKKLEGVK